MVNVLKFHKSAININLAFGKLLFSHTEQRARYFHPSMHGEALFDIAVKISNLSDVNNVVERIARMDLSADLRLPRDNSSYSGVMYTDFEIYHSPVYRTNRFKGPVRSIRNCCTQLPGWKQRDRSIISHLTSRKIRRVYNDRLCMFRALALYHLGIVARNQLKLDHVFDAKTEQLLLRYTEFKQGLMNDNIEMGPSFPTKELEQLDIKENGVSHNEISLIEQCFDINIVLLTKGENGHAVVYRNSCYRHDSSSSKIVYLDLYEDHVSYIIDIDRYSGAYMCRECGQSFGRLDHLKKHMNNRRGCSKHPIHDFPGGYF